MKTALALAVLFGAVLCVDYYPQQQQQQQNYYYTPQQQQQHGDYPQAAYGQNIYDMFVKNNPEPAKPLDGEFIEGTLKAGGEGEDVGLGIAVTKYYVFVVGVFTERMDIGGKTIESIHEGTDNEDIFVACFRRYDATLKWVKVAGGTKYDEGFKIAVNEAGTRVYVVGHVTRPIDGSKILFSESPWEVALNVNDGVADSYCGFVACYKAKDGKLVWARAAVPVGDANLEMKDVSVETVDSRDYIYVCGFFIGEEALFYGQFSTLKLKGKGSADLFVAKYDGEGWVKWARSGGGTGADYALSLALDDHVIYTTGYFTTNKDAYIAKREGDATEVQALTGDTANGQDIFLAMFSKYDGEFLGARVCVG
jgi:hypothetical protein